MDVKELNSKKLFKEYSILIPYDEIDNLINIKIKEIIPTLTLPGFRKGKAPTTIVKKKYEDSVLNEVLEKIVQEKTKELLDQKKLKAFRQPKVELKKYVKNEPLELGIKIDLQPDIKIYPFEKISTNKYSIEIDKKSYEENYKSFLNSQNNYKLINDENREIKNSDKIFVDIDTSDKDVPDFLKSQKNIPIVTDSDYQVLPDISKLILKSKMKKGDSKVFKINLKNILNDNKNKDVNFNIKILSIEEKINFEVTKDFLDKNKFKNEKELKDQINTGLKNQYNKNLQEIEKKQLMDILESKNEFDIPEGIYEEEFNIIWHRVEHAKKEKKLDPDDNNLSEAKLRKRYEKIALRRVKLAILMQEIANENKISVTEKELTNGMLEYASQYPGQEKQIFDYFKKNPSSIESIRGPIFEKKIVDLIFTKTKVESKKISVKDFNKLQESTFNINKKDGWSY